MKKKTKRAAANPGPRKKKSDNIPKRLAAWREAKGFNRKEAAEFFGVPLRTYTDAETGDHLPRGFGKTFVLRVLAEHEGQTPSTKKQ